MDEKSKKIKLLPLEALKKALDERGIEYDDMEIKRPYFPLEDVEACLYDTTPSFIRHLSATYIKDNANRRAWGQGKSQPEPFPVLHTLADLPCPRFFLSGELLI